MTTTINISDLQSFEGFFDSCDDYHVLIDWFLDSYNPDIDDSYLVILVYFTKGEGFCACAFNIDPLGNLIDCDLIFV